MMTKKLEFILGIFFIMVASGVIIHITLLSNKIKAEHAELSKHIECNEKLIETLQKRSEGRALVDVTTRDVQNALVSYFNDIIEHGSFLEPNDPHVIDIRNKHIIAAQARVNANLLAPYPDCK